MKAASFIRTTSHIFKTERFWNQFCFKTYRHVWSLGNSARDSRLIRVMKLDTPEFHSLFTDELRTVDQLFRKYDFELRIAGGAVRDLLMGKMPDDVDFATTATPEQMMALFDKEQIRMLNKRGEKHGTVTCRINDKENFEITTLRIDVLCDGRRAEVQFTTDWYLDAMRRDLTVNSIFLGLDGTVYDYFGGIQDIENRRVVFVEDPAVRIREDYLRILRYFRFFGRIAKTPDQHEPGTLNAIKENVEGLQQVSGERIWVELKKIVVGRFAVPIMKTMLAECNLGPYIGLPGNADLNEFKRVYERVESEKFEEPKPMTVLAAIFLSDNEVLKMDKRLKVSRNERLQALFILKYRGETGFKSAENRAKYFQDLFLDEGGDKIPDARERVCELLKYLGEKEIFDHMQKWEEPTFPVNGFLVVDSGIKKGPAMKRVLNHLFQLWKASNYEATAGELLKHAHDLDDESPQPLKQGKT